MYFIICAKKHITVPYEFHCITEDPKGLDPHIKINKPYQKTDPHGLKLGGVNYGCLDRHLPITRQYIIF